jgi:hypothetical protein
MSLASDDMLRLTWKPLSIQNAAAAVSPSTPATPITSSSSRSGTEVLPDDHGALSDDDEFTGDETARDYATERVTPSAEESALHIEQG